MFKKFIICTLTLLCALTPTAFAGYSVQYDEETSYTYEDIDVLQTYIKEQEFFKDAAHNMADSARELGYEDTHMIITLAKSRYNEASEIQKSYQAVIDELNAHWNQKANEYPTAFYIWNYLKNAGYNDYVVAGLMGNMMRESGGHTLNIQPYVYSSTGGYYGICQWSRAYGIHGASLDTQLALLVDTLPETMNTWGRLYYRGFNYNQFCNLQDAQQAALAFSKCYERGASFTHSYGARNAVKAYNYFTN